jgi:hypothetical protein
MNETIKLKRRAAGHWYSDEIDGLHVEIVKRATGRPTRDFPFAWDLTFQRDDGKRLKLVDHVNTLDGVREVLRALIDGSEVLAIDDGRTAMWAKSGVKNIRGEVWFDVNAEPEPETWSVRRNKHSKHFEVVSEGVAVVEVNALVPRACDLANFLADAMNSGVRLNRDGEIECHRREVG